MKNKLISLLIVLSSLTMSPVFAHPGHDHSSPWSPVVHMLFTADRGLIFLLLGLVVSYLAIKGGNR